MKRSALFRWIPFRLAALVAPLIAAWPQQAQAANQTWTGTTSAVWHTTTNWSGGAFPGANGAGTNADIATFNGSVATAIVGLNQTTAGGTFSLGAIDMNRTVATALTIGNNTATAGVLRLNGATLTSANTLVRVAGSADMTLSGPGVSGGTATMGVQLGITNGIFDVGASRTLTISSIISQLTAGSGFTKSGAGTLLLSGANTYTGVTDVNAGTLRATVAGALGTGTAANTVTLSGGNLELFSDTATTFGRNFTVTANSTITTSRATGGTANSHTMGTLSIGNFTLTSNSAVATSGTQGLIVGATTMTGDATFNVPTVAAMTNALTMGAVGETGGPRNFTKTGGSLMILGAAGTYTGTTTINDGTLRIQNATALGTGTSTVQVFNNINLASGSDTNTLQFSGGLTVTRNLLLENAGSGAAGAIGGARTALTSTSSVNATANTWSGTITVKGQQNQSLIADTAPLILGGQVLNDGTTPSSAVFFRGTNTGTIAAASTINLGAANFFKTDAGTWIANNTTGMTVGSTQVADGTLTVGANNALSTTAPLIIGQGSVTSGTLNIASGISQTLASVTVFAGSTGTQRITGPGSLDTAGVNRTYLINDSAGIPQDLIISAPITGSGGFTKTGLGTLAVNSSVAGPVTVSDGRLEGAGAYNSGLTINAGSTLSPGSDGLSALFTTTSFATGAGASTINLNVGSSGEVIGNTGTITAGGTTTINLFGAGSLPNSGHVALINHNGSFAGTTGFALGTLPGRVVGVIDNNGSAVTLNISGNDKVIWTGAAGAPPTGEAWDINTTQNWKLQSNSNPTNFLQGDDLIFDGTGANALNVTLNAAVLPARAEFTNNTADTTPNYIIKGSGGMGGAMVLDKTGTGNVTLAPAVALAAANYTAHGYSGATNVSNGTLVLDYSAMTSGTAATQDSSRVINSASAVTIGSGATLKVQRNNNNAILDNNLTGSGTLLVDLSSGGTAAAKNFMFTGNSAGFSGTIRLSPTGGGATGTFRTINAAQNGAAPAAAFGTALIDVDAGGQFWGASATYANNFRVTGAGYAEVGGGATPDADLVALGFANYAGIGAMRMENGSVFNGGILLEGSAKLQPFNGTATVNGSITRTNATDVLVVGGGNNNVANTLVLAGDNSTLGRIWVNSAGSGGTAAFDVLQIGNNGTTGTLGAGNVTLHADAARGAGLRIARSDGYALGVGQDILPDVAAAADHTRLRLYVNATGTGFTINNNTIDLSDGTNGGLIHVAGNDGVNPLNGAIFTINGASSLVDTGNFFIGDAPGTSAGTVNQNNGTVNVAGHMRIGHWPGGTSNYNISGGTLNFTGASPATTPSGTTEAATGGVYLGVDGTGNLTQSGTSIINTKFVILDNRGAAAVNATPGTDTLALNGGTLNLTANWGIIARHPLSSLVALSGGSIVNAAAAGTAVMIDAPLSVGASGGTLNTSANATSSLVLTRDVTGAGNSITLTGAGKLTLQPNSKTVLDGVSDGLGTQLISVNLNTGSVPIEKIGTGTTTLSGTNTNTGLLTLTVGRLNLTGSYAGALTAAGTTTLAGEGTAASLSLAGAGSLLLDGSTAGALTSTGTLTAAGITNVDFAVGPATSVVTVLNHGGTAATPANFALVNAANYRTSIFAVNAGNVTLDLGRKDLTWAGTTANWEIAGANVDWNAGVDNFFSGDGVTFNDSNGTNSTIALTGTLSPSAVIVNSDTNQFTFTGSAGNVLGGGTSLLKDGTSTLTINAPNTYTLGTTISEGEIFARQAAALSTGAITLGDANTATAVDAPALFADVNGAAATITMANAITVASQAGPVAIIGSTASSPVGALQANFSGALTLNDDAKFQTGAGDFTRFQGAVSGAGNVDIVNGSLTGDTRGNGGNRIILSGNANAWTGNLTIKAGTATNYTVFQTDTADILNDNVDVTVEDNAVLRVNANEGIDGLTGSSLARVRGVVAARTLTIGLGNNASSTFAGIMENDPFDGGSLLLTKSGNGTQILTGNNTFTGLTTVTAGVLQIGNGGATGDLAGALTINSGGTATVNRTGAITLEGALTLNGGGILNKSGSSTLTLAAAGGGTATGTVNINGGTIDLTATNPWGNNAAAPDVTIADGATLSFSGGAVHAHVRNVSMSGGSTWTAGTGTGNYTGENYQLNGDVTVSGGTTAALINRDVSRDNTNSGISLRGTRTFTVADVTGSAAADLIVSTELEASDNDTGVNQGALIKAGPGTMSLVGLHSYTGPTTVNNGTLRLEAGSSIASSSLLTVNSGGTVSGSGATGPIALGAGATISPGASPGIMNTGGVTTAGNVNIEIGGLNPGADHDQINTTGSVTLNGGILVVSLINSYLPAANDTFDIWLNDGGDSITGTFTGLAEGSQIPIPETTGGPGDGLNSDYWTITYLGNTGNDIRLLYVPEPSSALLAGAAGLLALSRRRRRA